jgi:hypothetical protein
MVLNLLEGLLLLAEVYECFRPYAMQELELIISPPCSVILVTVIMLSCHHPIDNVSIRTSTFIWTPDTHTRGGGGRRCQKAREDHTTGTGLITRRYWHCRVGDDEIRRT